MFTHTHRSALYPVVIVALALVGPLASLARANFILWNNEQLTVNTSHAVGTLNDQSLARIVSGGSVDTLTARNASTVDLSGGSVGQLIEAYDTSTVNISSGSANRVFTYGSSTVDLSGGLVDTINAYGPVDITGGTVTNFLNAYGTSTVGISIGSVGTLNATHDSTVDITGGSVGTIEAIGTMHIFGGLVSTLNAYHDTSAVDISGGSVSNLNVYDTSTVTFHARDFDLGAGLSLNGDRVLGTGLLSVEYFDGSFWTVNITGNGSDATILAIPEPTTLSLLGAGLAGLLRRRHHPWRTVRRCRVR